MSFENAPTPLYGIVLAMVGRIVNQAHWLADLIYPVHYPLEKLGSHAATFRAIIHSDLNGRNLMSGSGSELSPLVLQGIDKKITGFEGTAKTDP
jgi:hypothetical protein